MDTELTTNKTEISPKSSLLEQYQYVLAHLDDFKAYCLLRQIGAERESAAAGRGGEQDVTRNVKMLAAYRNLHGDSQSHSYEAVGEQVGLSANRAKQVIVNTERQIFNYIRHISK